MPSNNIVLNLERKKRFNPVYAIGFVVRVKKAKKMGDLGDFGTEAYSRPVGMVSTKIIQIAHL